MEQITQSYQMRITNFTTTTNANFSLNVATDSSALTNRVQTALKRLKGNFLLKIRILELARS